MEYVSGKTLAQLLREKKFLTENEAIPIFEQILLALEAAHGEDIVHRDIKPANIMITDDNRVKVMDFGIAKLPTLSMTVTGMVLGTPYYMSPEQIAGRKIDIRSDIFSLGAVFYQALTGEKPFEGDSTATITYKITLVEPVPPNVLNSNVSLPVAQIILRALSKDTDRRYHSPAEMLEDLRRLRQASAFGETSGSRIEHAAPAFQETVLAGKSETKSTRAGTVASPPPPPVPPPIPDSAPSGKPPAAAMRGKGKSPVAEEPEVDDEAEADGEVPEPVHIPRKGKGSPPAGRQAGRGEKSKVSGWLSGLVILAVVGGAAWFLLARPTAPPAPVGGSSPPPPPVRTVPPTAPAGPSVSVAPPATTPAVRTGPRDSPVCLGDGRSPFGPGFGGFFRPGEVARRPDAGRRQLPAAGGGQAVCVQSVRGPATPPAGTLPGTRQLRLPGGARPPADLSQGLRGCRRRLSKGHQTERQSL